MSWAEPRKRFSNPTTPTTPPQQSSSQNKPPNQNQQHQNIPPQYEQTEKHIHHRKPSKEHLNQEIGNPSSENQNHHKFQKKPRHPSPTSPSPKQSLSIRTTGPTQPKPSRTHPAHHLPKTRTFF